jgi:hypothetical protein
MTRLLAHDVEKLWHLVVKIGELRIDDHYRT